MTPLTKSNNKKEHSHSCNFCVLGTKFKIDVIYCTYKNGRRSSQGGQQRELRLEKHYYHQVWENIIFPFKSSVAWGTPSNPKSPLRSYGGFFCVCQKYAPSSEVPLLALYCGPCCTSIYRTVPCCSFAQFFAIEKKITCVAGIRSKWRRSWRNYCCCDVMWVYRSFAMRYW